MEALILIVLAILFVFVLIYLKNSFFSVQTVNKSKAVKKEEIIENYETKMKDLVLKHSSNKENLTNEKIKLLKQINHELSMNLFFDEIEAKQIIQKLSKIG